MDNETDGAGPEALETITGPEALIGLVEQMLPEAAAPDDQDEETQDQVPEEEPETEELDQDESTEDETGEEDEDSEEAEDDSDPGESKAIARMQERINRLTAEKHSLKDDLKEAKKALRDKPGRQAAAEYAGFLSQIDSVETVDELQELQEEAEDLAAWVSESITDYQIDPDAVEQDVRQRLGDALPDDDDLDILQHLRKFRGAIREAKKQIPRAKENIILREQSDKLAFQFYPWLEQPENQIRQVADEVLDKWGDTKLKDIPDKNLFLGRYVLGLTHEQQAVAKATPKGKPAKKRPTAQPGRSAGNRVRGSGVSKPDKAAKGIRSGAGFEGLVGLVSSAIE